MIIVSLTRLLNYLPRGNLLDDVAWRKRHKFLLWVLFLHIPAFLVFGLWLGYSVVNVGLFVLAAPTACLLLGSAVPHRQVASFFVTAGLVYCPSALVGLTNGNIEAHFHFFIIIGFIVLYQDWVPFLWNIVFTMLSHGIGTVWQTGLIFNHPSAQTSPWVWSAIHGIAVLCACVGVVIFWRTTEDEQQKAIELGTRLAGAELNQRKFTSELLVNLARRNQSMLYRQLDIINQLEEKERDPDALGELFRLDHLDRVAFAVDERMEVLGHTVTDLTHVLAELTENAVRFSPPEANVTIRTRPYLRIPGAAVLTVEDWGVGMRPGDMTAANELLAHPRDVDLSMSQRLGLHVVARLAARHHIQASLTPTPGTGVTAVVVLPAGLFASNQRRPAPNELAQTAGRTAPTGGVCTLDPSMRTRGTGRVGGHQPGSRPCRSSRRFPKSLPWWSRWRYQHLRQVGPTCLHRSQPPWRHPMPGSPAASPRRTSPPSRAARLRRMGIAWSLRRAGVSPTPGQLLTRRRPGRHCPVSRPAGKPPSSRSMPTTPAHRTEQVPPHEDGWPDRRAT